MKTLAVDPGMTTGLVILKEDQLVWSWTLRKGVAESNYLIQEFLHWVRRFKPDVVVIEDFVPFQKGASLFTAKLVGAYQAVCVLEKVPVVTLVPAKKGRWPKARLDAKFPQHRACANVHERDALRIGLAYLEEQGWRP